VSERARTLVLQPIEERIERVVRALLSRWNPFVRLGTIPATYVPGSGLPPVLFDGETDPSGRGYPYLARYTPAPGDRVLLVRAGTRTWVIVDKVVSS